MDAMVKACSVKKNKKKTTMVSVAILGHLEYYLMV